MTDEPKPAAPRAMLAAADLAAELNVSRAAAYRLMKRMTHVKLGGSVRVTREALNDFIAASTRTPAPAAGAFTPARPWRARPRPAPAPEPRASDGTVPKWRSRPIVPRTKPRAPDGMAGQALRPITPRTKPRTKP